MNRPSTLLSLALASALLSAGEGLPLPPAPVRLTIPDVRTFNAMLTGSYRKLLNGTLEETDPLLSSWRRSQVGSKLEVQWAAFSKDLPLTWDQILKLQPSALGLAILQAGHLEAVLVLRSPLATLPFPLPSGIRKTHGGVTYTLVTPGAADSSKDPDRRMGLAWGRVGSHLILATSARAMRLAIDEALAGRSFAPTLAGAASMELDLEVLRHDRYFQREFPFPPGPEKGRIQVALRKEGGHWVEHRKGSGEPRNTVWAFQAPGAAVAGWEPEGQTFWNAFRRGLLEPVPTPSDRPVPSLRPLPTLASTGPEDRYAVQFSRPTVMRGATPWEGGDVALWNELLKRTPIPSWGFWVNANGIRRMVFPWPSSQDGAFLEHCRTTIQRRAGRATTVLQGGIREIQVGPGLPALAIRRTGAFLWVAPSAQALKDVPTPTPDPTLIRWARLNLTAVHGEAARWAKTEGPAQPERVRPLSDRVMGLLGWMPGTTAISTERRKTREGWTEQVVFGNGAP